jgi:hypothetical protein
MGPCLMWIDLKGEVYEGCRPDTQMTLVRGGAERVLNSASCNYYFIRDLFSARTRAPAELIEHTIQQDGATLVNQVNFVFVAKHFLDYAIRRQNAIEGQAPQ